MVSITMMLATTAAATALMTMVSVKMTMMKMKKNDRNSMNKRLAVSFSDGLID